MMDQADKRAQSSSSDKSLAEEREEVLRAFASGQRLAEDLLTEYQKLIDQLKELEGENRALRAKVEANAAMRQLLGKIEELEAEKRELLSRRVEPTASVVVIDTQAREIEAEFENLANLFVAANQIHSSLTPSGVIGRIKDVLAQLVGAEKYAVYLANPEASELVPVASEGVEPQSLIAVSTRAGRLGQVFRTRAAYIDEDRDARAGSREDPTAVIPLSIDDTGVGVIAVFATLPQKPKFLPVDFELFKLLKQHAAAALVSASLFARAERRLPGLESLMDVSV